MKKTVFIFTVLLFNFTMAQDGFFEEHSTEQTATLGPGGGGTEDDDYAPIDDYLPVLIITAIGVAYYYRKKLKTISQ